MHISKVFGSACGATAAALVLGANPALGTELPIPCAPCNVGGSTPLAWLASGTASLGGDATHLVVTAGTSANPNVVLNWQSFNVSADGSVQFIQPNATAIALNRIYQGDPSRIFGSLSANGQVYLINQNGILFGNPDGTPMQLNVQSLVASTLPMNATAIANGILAPIANDQAAFSGSTGSVQVSSGATLKSADGGRIAIFAPTINNAGHIETPNGQALLAAGQAIYLQSSDDPNLRGLLVEVDRGGTVTNSGSVLASEGNITLMGLAVNQNGRLTATTSVTKGGTINLLARDTVAVQVQSGGRRLPTASRTGTVEFGAGSVTEVALDTHGGETAVDDQPQAISAIAVDGKSIHMAGGSQVIAHGGTVAMTAELDPTYAGTAQPDAPGVQIQIDAGAVVDVSGGTVEVPMERNAVTVQLRGNELRDDPQQRDGVLRGQTVVVDSRVGTPLADVSGYVAAETRRTVTERLGNGGTVSLLSQGTAQVSAGATINLAGGAVEYQGGYVDTTRLIGANGQVYDIGSAPQDVTYVGLYGPAATSANKWGVAPVHGSVLGSTYEAGYTQGLAAGTLQVAARRLTLDGTVQAQTRPGLRQASAATLPLAGQLIIGLPGGRSGGGQVDYLAPSLWLGDAAPQGSSAIPLERLNAQGVGRFALYSDGRITLPGDAQLAPGTSVSLVAPAIDLHGSVVDHGGAFAATSANVDPQFALAPAGLTVAGGSRFDLGGLWTNDFNSAANPGIRYVNGGSLVLATSAVGAGLVIGDGVVIDVSAGAAAGSTGALAFGNAGAATLSATGLDSTLSLGAGVTLRGYGVGSGSGGSFTLVAPAITLADDGAMQVGDLVLGGPQASAAGVPLQLGSSLFRAGGFSRFSLTADQGSLAVLPGTQLVLEAASHQLADGYLERPSSSPLSAFTTAGYLPEYQRKAGSLSLAMNLLDARYDGSLSIGRDAVVGVDAKGSIALKSMGGGLYVDGSLRALAGNISLTANQLSTQAFDPAFALWLGDHALVDVSGTTVRVPDGSGNTELQLLNAGAITATTSGYLVTAQGSVLRASGQAARGDLQSIGFVQHLYDRAGGNQQEAGSAAGLVNLRAGEGMLLQGGFDAHAGTSSYAGGELDLTVDRTFRTGNVAAGNGNFPVATAQVVIGQSVAAPSSVPAFGTALDTATYGGIARIAASQVAEGGIDALSLKALQVQFDNATPITLSLGRQLTLNAQQFIATGHGTIALSAPSVTLQSPARIASGNVLAGTARLQVMADNIDLVGAMAFSGLGEIDLQSSGDIRLRGAPDQGSLSTVGTLALQADRIFPATMSSFTLSAADPAGGIGTINILSNGKPANLADGLLSAGGSITLRAGDINQGGVLEAPLGSIVLDARDSLTLAPGSLTSVHASAAQILMGRTINLADWYYSANGSAALSAADQLYGATRQAFPSKGISLNANSLSVASGATVDYSGGGDAVAWEQVPGPGGSSDLLSVANAGGLYAVIPASAGYGPVDPAEYAQWGLAPGAAVTLYQPANGLPAGTYALLPPRYALLPGAYLVKAASGYANMDPSQSVQLNDGSAIVAGANTWLNTGLQSGATTGFQVYKGSQAYQLAEYHLASANGYLPGRAASLGVNAPALPVDAGSLSLSGRGALALYGTFSGLAGSGGKASQVDVSATQLAVVAQVDPSVQATQITASNLEALGAGSLLLGGKRTQSAGGTSVAVQASSVTIGDGVALSLPELLLVGSDRVTVGANARLSAAGSGTSTGGTYLFTGDSARLLLSNARGAQVLASYAGGAPAGQRGVVTTGIGSVLATSGSLVLDGARDLVLGGQLAATAGSTVSLASSRVTLGDAVPAGTGGLVLDSANLARLANVDLSLKGRNGIDITAAVSVNVANLVLDAPVILGQLASADDVASLTSSGTLALRNGSGNVAAATAPALAGNLVLAARSVSIEAPSIALAGFSKSQLSGSDSITGKGTASLAYQGNLVATTPVLSVASGASLAVNGAGASSGFRLESPVAAVAADNTSIGGALAITAGTITQAGNIVMHAGTVSLDGANGVTLASGSRTNVSGLDVAMPGLTTPVAAGTVSLSTQGGALLVQASATVDVSGSSGGGDAGLLELATRGGQAAIDTGANLAGGVSKPGALTGSFSLDTGSLGAGDFTSLNSQLNAAGLDGLRSFRFTAPTPSVSLAAGASVDARGFSLVVEQGGIDIAGQVNVANAGSKATLGLYARDTVHVATTGALTATSQAAGTTEAEIDLFSTLGGITVDAGARLAAQAPNATAGVGGAIVHYRLSQDQVAAGGFKVAAGTVLAGTRQLVEGYRAYDLADGLVDTETVANTGNAVYRDAAAFMASAPVAALKSAGYEVAPGIELTSAGDMTLASPWNLAQWRFAGQPGVLTVRAGGSLEIAQSLSDGFASTLPSAALRSDRSWSYNLVAGADLGSADVLRTSAQAPSALLSVDADVLVRTGTGDIHVASAGDVALLGSVTPDDPYGQGVIYTAGRSAALELDRATSGALASKYLPVDGGSLGIRAGHDIVGSPSDNEFTQFFVEWYQRQPKQAREAAGMWINYDAFQQQFAAFGGGDLDLQAGHDLVRVSASVPTTAYVDGNTGTVHYLGSGSLVARAGNDIASNQFLVGRGTGTIDAGGALTATSSGPYGGTAIGTVLAAMDTQYTVRTRGDLVLSAVVNPTSIGQVNQLDSQLGYFLSYSPTASTSLTSLTGNVTLQNNGTLAVGNDVTGLIPFFSGKDESVYTGNFAASALHGNLVVEDAMYLAPAATGNLQLAAWGNLVNRGAEVLLSDLDPATLPTIANQQSVAPSYLDDIYSSLSGQGAHAVPAIHAADGSTARLVAATGDLTGGFWFINRPGLVFAGRDIRDLRYNGENFASTDVTRIVAGRDIRFGAGNANYGINLAGPGGLSVVAGRNIDLGPSFGIVTEGNLVNPGLANDGANITVMAGVSGDVDASLAGIPADTAIADLFMALRTAGRDVAKGLAADFQPGFDAADKVFPRKQAAGQQGDLTMVQSRIYTLDGGDINLVVPHGSVNVGVAQAAAGAVVKLPSQLGIVTEKSGAVRAFVDGDFLVNSSRVFTLGGGDILVWSSNGNIDAGRGAKTTISAPEPTITIDPQGNVQQNFGAAIAGSGIRGILAQKGVAPGDVDLFAPRGFVSAGDAGIGSAGNVTIAAVRVVGADNINFGGTAVGVPVDTGGLGASLASVSAASSSASNTATESASAGSGDQAKTPLATEALSWLEVFVLGLGEDNCKQDDLDCLKRQKKALN